MDTVSEQYQTFKNIYLFIYFQLLSFFLQEAVLENFVLLLFRLAWVFRPLVFYRKADCIITKIIHEWEVFNVFSGLSVLMFSQFSVLNVSISMWYFICIWHGF